MTNVYIVTSGDYSDYRINAVFNNPEDAQKYVDAGSLPYASHRFGSLDDPQVEIFELQEGDTGRVIVYEVNQWFDAKGQAKSDMFICEDLNLIVGGDDEGIPRGVEWQAFAEPYKSSTYPPRYNLRARSTDRDLLLKAFGEKKAFISENPAWLDQFAETEADE